MLTISVARASKDGRTACLSLPNCSTVVTKKEGGSQLAEIVLEGRTATPTGSSSKEKIP